MSSLQPYTVCGGMPVDLRFFRYQSQSAIIKKMAACRSQNDFFQIKIGSKNIKIYLTNHINLNQICLLSHENLC